MRTAHSIGKRIRRRRAADKKHVGLNLISLIDILTSLVFFLLMSAGTIQTIAPPDSVTLPPSTSVEPPLSVTDVIITTNDIIVGGNSVMSLSEITSDTQQTLPKLGAALQAAVNPMQLVKADSEKKNDVTILADKTIPFSVLRKIIAACATIAGSAHVSLAVTHIDAGVSS